jgi:hypothetical protein
VELAAAFFAAALAGFAGFAEFAALRAIIGLLCVARFATWLHENKTTTCVRFEHPFRAL